MNMRVHMRGRSVRVAAGLVCAAGTLMWATGAGWRLTAPELSCCGIDYLSCGGTAGATAFPPSPAITGGAQPGASTHETPAQRDARMNWWREARFGMFIHWGLYSIPAGEWKGQEVPGIGEWIMNSAQIPVAEYEPLTKQFNPVKFNADEWVSIAKRAGMKYIVITSKHHDGFCLWDSKLTDYDVMDATPFKRDILRELYDAAQKQGMTMCFYHSIMDWHHPDYLPRRPWDPRPDVKADFPKYVEHLRGQVSELLTNFPKTGILWFDGEWENTWTHEQGQPLYDLCRKLAPGVIVNNRVDKGRGGMAGMSDDGFAGDYGTPEQEIPSTGLPGVDWESCMTMNDTWGFKKSDHNWKSSSTLIRMLIETSSKGGNFLLNVGPTSEGVIPPESVERLATVGGWLAANGEAIYGTHAGPFKKLPWGRATAKPEGANTALYLCVYDWPSDGVLRVPGLLNKALSASVLGGGESMARHDGDDVVIKVGNHPRNPYATVVKLVVEGQPKIVEVAIRSGSDGTLSAMAADAEVVGHTARFEGEPKSAIGWWMDAKDSVKWNIELAKGGKFAVETESACAPGNGGSYRVLFSRDGKDVASIEANVMPTKSWEDFSTQVIGAATLDAGKYELRVVPVKVEQALMNLRRVTVRPNP